jgi:hypothetical protein
MSTLTPISPKFQKPGTQKISKTRQSRDADSGSDSDENGIFGSDQFTYTSTKPKFDSPNDDLNSDYHTLDEMRRSRWVGQTHGLHESASKLREELEYVKEINDRHDEARSEEIKRFEADWDDKRDIRDEPLAKAINDVGNGANESLEKEGVWINLVTLGIPAITRSVVRGAQAAKGNTFLKRAKEVPLADRTEENRLRHKLSQVQAQIAALKEKESQLQQKVNSAGRKISTLDSTIGLAQKAVDPSPFHKRHYLAVHEGLTQAPYRRIERMAEYAKSQLIKIPGVSNAYSQVTGHVWKEDGVQEVLSDLKTDDEKAQKIALKRLYPLESRNPKESQKVYLEFLKHKNPRLAKTALEMTVKYPAIRPNEQLLPTLLVDFLRSGEPSLAKASLNAIEQLQIQDPSIDTALKQLARSRSRYSPEALKLWNLRQQTGLAPEQNPEKDAQLIADLLVGNPEVVNKLKILLSNYYYAQEHAPEAVTPGMILYLPGRHGTGKTSLVSQVQTVLSGGKREMIHIKPKNIGPDNRLADMLRRSTPPNDDGIHDLSGKVIFFDEFQGVDSIHPQSEQEKFLEDLKDLFAVDNADIKTTQQWLQKEKIRLRNPVMAIASNKPLSDLTAIEELSQGQALLDRLSQVTRVSSANRLVLNPELGNNIDEFIAKFGDKQYFRNINVRKFTGPVTLTPNAERELSNTIKREAKDSEGQVTGRKLATWMVNDLNSAIDRYLEPFKNKENPFSTITETDC